MGLRRVLLVLLLIVVVAAIAVGVLYVTRGPSRSNMVLGLQDDALLTSAEPLAVPTVHALDPPLIRYNIVWSDIASKRPADPSNPSDPAYAWTNADKIVALAKSLNASLLFTIVDAPRWANGGASPQHTPTRPADFGTFCGVVAQRYPTVARYTIWNEPNRGQFLQPQGAGGKEAPRALAGLARACIPGDPRGQPEGERGDRARREPRRPGWARADPVPRRLPRRRRSEARCRRAEPVPRGAGARCSPRTSGRRTARSRCGTSTGCTSSSTHAYGTDMPIWLTEFAVRTVPPVTDADQARQLRETVDLVRDHYPYVPLLVWFLLRDQGPHDYWRSGLVDTAWHRKPAFAVFRSLSS